MTVRQGKRKMGYFNYGMKDGLLDLWGRGNEEKNLLNSVGEYKMELHFDGAVEGDGGDIRRIVEPRCRGAIPFLKILRRNGLET